MSTREIMLRFDDAIDLPPGGEDELSLLADCPLRAKRIDFPAALVGSLSVNEEVGIGFARVRCRPDARGMVLPHAACLRTAEKIIVRVKNTGTVSVRVVALLTAEWISPEEAERHATVPAAPGSGAIL